jgi:hypothetical protein
MTTVVVLELAHHHQFLVLGLRNITQVSKTLKKLKNCKNEVNEIFSTKTCLF